MKDTRDATKSATRGTEGPGSESAVQRAEAHGIDVARLRAMLQRAPTERLEMLRARTQHGEGAIARAEAYGIDVSLLELALTWTPTERIQKMVELAAMVRTLHQAGAKKHGTRAYPLAIDEL